MANKFLYKDRSNLRPVFFASLPKGENFFDKFDYSLCDPGFSIGDLLSREKRAARRGLKKRIQIKEGREFLKNVLSEMTHRNLNDASESGQTLMALATSDAYIENIQAYLNARTSDLLKPDVHFLSMPSRQSVSTVGKGEVNGDFKNEEQVDGEEPVDQTDELNLDSSVDDSTA